MLITLTRQASKPLQTLIWNGYYSNEDTNSGGHIADILQSRRKWVKVEDGNIEQLAENFTYQRR